MLAATGFRKALFSRCRPRLDQYLRTSSHSFSTSQHLHDKLHKFVVYAPDNTDEGTLAKRFRVRAKHLEGIGPHVQAGGIQVGGMMVTPDSISSDTAEKKAVGSLLIVQAADFESAKKLIEEDIYYTSGVWNKQKLVILPFLPATPFPP